jgi:pyrroline-5-carboxylate reductase
MGGAMLAGWVESGFPAEDVTVVDPSPNPAMTEKLQAWGIECLSLPGSDYEPDVLLIAVKPQLMDAVLPTIRPNVGMDTVSVSVAAGTTLATLQAHLGGIVVRAMPNTPALVQRGITVCCPTRSISDLQRGRVDTLLQSIGSVEWVEEEALIDAVTAVSGSGPAYVFHLAECMASAGIEQGLSPELANRLARQTIAGAGEMLSMLPEDASQLRKNVTSPNGTTAAALGVLMENDAMMELFSKAIAAARKRSQELS